MSYFLTDFLNYFDVKQLAQLKLTCKQFNESITNDRLDKMIINEIKERLKSYVSDYDQFQDFF